jgi:hypothetical protein
MQWSPLLVLSSPKAGFDSRYKTWATQASPPLVLTSPTPTQGFARMYRIAYRPIHILRQ